MRARVAWLVLGVLTLACALAPAEPTSSLSLDGVPFAVTRCSNDQVPARGVDLHGAAGDKIRIVQTWGGRASVAYFAAGAEHATVIGESCGTITTRTSAGDSSALDGEATLDCAGWGRNVVGEARFRNCGASR
ncbi:MAG: hypothetical protein KF729_25095 [Sandaracinaceae bacterium]|nr:hypothetical protein [Sandaracinaceae bacterium]